ncbi:4-alpha-glucanotransferase (amylomaltase) [hydrothermal vent metagenome]|uniref:4-alpha-glucanotransferase n=1 Tax=hydrothermal vent metagenome TaxID=652676 RepID=A0A3B1A344_9ZZZZ
MTVNQALSRNVAGIFKQRSAGILLHPTSLPGPLLSGDIGHNAYRFIEFLNGIGIKVWQMLPLGPTHEDRSPYQCLSAHAANPELISLDWLVDRQWLELASITLPLDDKGYRGACLLQAKANFYQQQCEEWFAQLAIFKKGQVAWLEDYALYVALKKKYRGAAWFAWPAKLAQRDMAAMSASIAQLSDEIEQVIFEQFVFFTQWHELHEYAARHDVKLFGDMPIFVAHDSADVWASRQNFLMDKNGVMPFVAGVPPDAFSETGQRWGNPLYDWEYMASDDFEWWKGRFATQLTLFDLIRIDHFRGLEACWMIPADEDTAMNGHWQKTPGDELLAALFESFPYLPLVAEDLGVITDEVIALKNSYLLPGMKVLQFAFDGNNDNPHLPHHQLNNDLVYTGTHDNDTTLGWACDENSYNRTFFEQYAGCGGASVEEKVHVMLRMAMASPSCLAVIPMQDLLMLGSEARMNVPGTVGDNWQWRFEWSQLKPEMVDSIKHYIESNQR